MRVSNLVYLISRFTDNCAFKYRFPMEIPRIATAIPGKRNMGLKMTMTLSFVNMPMNSLKTQYSD